MSEHTARPAVTVAHSVPGRVRIRLSHPPADVAGLIDFIREHPGMGQISHTARTGSLLVAFDPRAISSEEITLRTAFGFAIDQGNEPVRLLAAPEHVPLQNSAILSGVGLFTAFAMQWLNLPKKNGPGVEWIAGLGTAWSVLDHGWRELRGRGYFDPEVLALAYLVPVDNTLSAAELASGEGTIGLGWRVRSFGRWLLCRSAHTLPCIRG